MVDSVGIVSAVVAPFAVVGVVVDVRRVPVDRVVVVIVGGGYPLRKSNRWATRLL